MSAPQLFESPISADVPVLTSPPTTSLPGTATAIGEPTMNSALGLRITVDLSEMSTASNQQDDFIVSQLLGDDEPEEELLTADEKAAAAAAATLEDSNKPEIRFVDKAGILVSKEMVTKNAIITQDKRYINRHTASAFVLGIERGTEEWKQRVANRNARFGTSNDPEIDSTVTAAEPAEMIPVEDFDVGALYESIGLTPEVLTKEAGSLRLCAIHVRGLDEMSTDDILEHFGAFNPAFLEWIDDTSCNVVWQDEISSARALFSLSKAIEEKEATDEVVVADEEEAGVKAENAVEIEDTEVDAEGAKMDTMDVEMPQLQQQELEAKESGEKIAVDQEEKDAHLSSEDETENVLKTLGVAKMYADREPGETSSISDDDDDDAFAGSGPGPKRKKSEDLEQEEGDRIRVIKNLKWRTGSWKGRVQKERSLFMRFSTIYDKKQQGANKYSKYYEKYGNPNYNNMPGLISNSMRRRLAGTKRRQQLEEARAALEVLGGSHRDTDVAIGELAAMGAGTAVGEDDEIEAAVEIPARNRKPSGDLRNSGWTTRTKRESNGRPFTLNRTEDDDEPVPQRPARGRVGSSEGRCPPPSPRGRRHHKDDVSGDEWISTEGEDASDSQSEDYSSEEEDPVKQLLSAIPARGRGSTRTKMYADDEERKRRREIARSSKMRSDEIGRKSRSRSRSPIGFSSVKPSRNFFGDEPRSRSLRDRLGPAISSGNGGKFSRSNVRNDRDRNDRQRNKRHREDIRSRLDR